jgi:hypothetical protein
MIKRNRKSVESFLSRYAEKNRDCRMMTNLKKQNEPKYLHRTKEVLLALSEWMKDKTTV